MTNFPSGSNWGSPQLLILGFSTQPEEHEFAELICGRSISRENSDRLDQLKAGFGYNQDEWANASIPAGYGLFFEDLIEMLPHFISPVHTPDAPVTRGNSKARASYPSSTNTASTSSTFPLTAPLPMERQLKRPRQSHSVSPTETMLLRKKNRQESPGLLGPKVM